MAKGCCFTADVPADSVLDPKKRVRYFTGQVLGEDEFRQDQLYLMSRDELHQRALHGYGRVSGLSVGQRAKTGGGIEIVVGAGLAVNPRGETICVGRAQCADLNAWLQAHRDNLLGSPPLALPGAATLYLVLCARDCQTDLVPVLGDPCRVLDEATAASRIADDFELCFRLDPPVHAEAQAITELGALLRSIEITDAVPGITPAELAQLVRDTFLPSSPPGGAAAASPPAAFTLHPDDALVAYEAALAVWVTEVRPTLNPETGACDIPRDGDAGRCVLIGCLEVPFDDGANGLEVSGTVTIDGTCGPLLLSTGLLQELGLGLLPALAGFALASPPGGVLLGSGGGSSPPVEELALPPSQPQVVSTSWVHDNASLLRLVHDGADAFGLALGFGLAGGGPAPVDPATLTDRSLRVRLREDDPAGPPGLPLRISREIVAAEIVPVDVRTQSGQIVATRTSGTPGETNGVLFRLSDDAARALTDRQAQLFLELATDHILDLEGRPISAAFPRTGGASAASGRFESWLEVGRPQIVIRGIDLNRSPANELRRLPGINRALAERIVARREGLGGFELLDDLASVPTLRPDTIDALRELMET